MKWIVKEGKDMFNPQANSFEIAKGIQEDLDMEIIDSGMTITGFNIISFSYPEEIQEMINKTASHTMVGDLGRFQQISMTEGISSGKVKGGGAASDMAGMMMGMNVAKEMMKNMEEKPSSQSGTKPNFCPNCGQKVEGGNFCSNCGEKL